MFSWTDNVLWTDSEITKRGNALIAAKFPEFNRLPMEAKSIGASRGKHTLSADEEAEENAFMVHALSVKEGENGTDTLRLLYARKRAVMAYEDAVKRLAQYIKADGRPEQLYQEATYDEVGSLLTEEVPYIAPINPEPLQLERPTYDADGNVTGTEWYDNPVVVKDVAERTAAQAVIDGASQQVLDDLLLR